MSDIKKQLADFVASQKRQKATASAEEYERIRRNLEDRDALVSQVGADIARMLEPVLRELPKSAQMTAEQLASRIHVQAPAVDVQRIEQAVYDAVSQIKIPAPIVTVEAPKVTIPPFPEIPRYEAPENMNVMLNGVSRETPLPMLMVDVTGKPVNMGSAVAGGGKTDFLTIKDIRGSTASIIDQIDGALRVTGSFSASLSLDYGSGEVGAATPRFVQASDAISSVAVKEIFGSTITTSVLNGDNRIRVSLETGGSGLTDSELRASSVPVEQVSGSNWSTVVTQVFGSTASDVVNPDGRLKVELPSGATGLTDTELRASSFNIGQVSGANWSVNVTNAITSTISVGDLESDAADTGSAPVKIGGIARQANPTPVAAGDRVSATYDDLGRQLVRPVQVRDLVKTAYATLTNGTETTLLAASSGSYHDLMYVMGANNSDAAVTVHIRPVTAGNIVMSLQIPASGTAGVSLPVPIPQEETGNNWTADMDDITGTSVFLSALFSREV